MADAYPSHEGMQVVSNQQPVSRPEQAPEVLVEEKQADAKVDNHYQPYNDLNNAQPKARFALSSRIALLLAVAIILVVGAVVGGAVGGTQAKKKKDVVPTSTISSTTSSSPTTTTHESTSSSSSGAPRPTSGILALDCPRINGTSYSTNSGSSTYNFLLLCKTDFKTTTGNIDSSRQYSFTDCIDSCAARNSAKALPQCSGLTWGANLTHYTGVNCFLKAAITSSVPFNSDDPQAGALLLT
ncbi:hypothetical protein BT63DRAFT_419476 [Microthyrium microscopicum]|uniref:Apple domain-containing protein n=1 Tax=Microthyrium microscopicum TaxID=703497 RepID=A0A6A6US04_9PEZI|nr:hypothetical protein BT63DRAFT_419476 [Microthyrium microscopicum]